MCCESCYEITHTFFECPICNNKDAGTTIYESVYEVEDKNFECLECGASFKIISIGYEFSEIEFLGNKTLDKQKQYVLIDQPR